MYKRTTQKERQRRKALRFERHHPRNKHVLHRRVLRAWAYAEGRRILHQVLHKMADEGNKSASNLLFGLTLFGAGPYLYQ